MLSAANDILKRKENFSGNSTMNSTAHNTTNRFDCNPISTGVSARKKESKHLFSVLQ